MSDRLIGNLVCAVRVLDAADRALGAREAGLADLVLRFEQEARGAIRPAGGAIPALSIAAGFDELSMLNRLVARADTHAAAPARQSDLSRRECLAF